MLFCSNNDKTTWAFGGFKYKSLSPFMSQLSVEGRTCSTSSFKVSGTSILGIYSTWSLAVFPVSWHMRKTEGIANMPAAPATVSFSTFSTFYAVDCIIIQNIHCPTLGCSTLWHSSLENYSHCWTQAWS